MPVGARSFSVEKSFVLDGLTAVRRVDVSFFSGPSDRSVFFHELGKGSVATGDFWSGSIYRLFDQALRALDFVDLLLELRQPIR